jgi:hypothetical protein
MPAWLIWIYLAVNFISANLDILLIGQTNAAVVPYIGHQVNALLSHPTSRLSAIYKDHAFVGLGHRFGHARVFLEARQAV